MTLEESQFKCHRPESSRSGVCVGGRQEVTCLETPVPAHQRSRGDLQSPPKNMHPENGEGSPVKGLRAVGCWTTRAAVLGETRVEPTGSRSQFGDPRPKK